LSHDTAHGNPVDGFNLDQAKGNVLSHDEASGNGDGYGLLAGSTSNVLVADIGNNNGVHGFAIYLGATGNTISSCDENLAGTNAWTGDRFSSTSFA
jgi:hypothetical protein